MTPAAVGSRSQVVTTITGAVSLSLLVKVVTPTVKTTATSLLILAVPASQVDEIDAKISER